MTVRILNPLDWANVTPGQWLPLNGDHNRVLKIEVNCEAPTAIHLKHHDLDGAERRTFLCVVQGIEKIEVVADAEAGLEFTSDGEVWFCTNDGVFTAVEIPEEASFTKLLTRKTRNEQLEQIVQLQHLGMQRLMQQQEAERAQLEQLLAERAAAEERPQAVVVDPAAAAPGAAAQQEPPAAPAPVPAAGEGASPAPAAPSVPA